MDNKTKVVTGISATGALLLVYHIVHLAFAANDLGNSRDTDSFKNANVYFIQTDSIGKRDTMMMKDYLKKNKK